VLVRWHSLPVLPVVLLPVLPVVLLPVLRRADTQPADTLAHSLDRVTSLVLRHLPIQRPPRASKRKVV
jgi:hypothetical protein